MKDTVSSTLENWYYRQYRSEDGLAVDLDAGGHKGDRAGGEDDVLGSDNFVGARLLDLVRASVHAFSVDLCAAERQASDR